jgi:acyl-coenzyme A thioesterase PaaI-like protein
LENPHGLQIEIRRGANDDSFLTGRFVPAGHMAGFPGITHGGAIYTAMDCMSTWVATLLGPNRGAAWLLRSASATYHKPAPTDQPMTLLGRVNQQGGAWDPVKVHVEARRADGSLCVGEFKVVRSHPTDCNR